MVDYEHGSIAPYGDKTELRERIAERLWAVNEGPRWVELWDQLPEHIQAIYYKMADGAIDVVDDFMAELLAMTLATQWKVAT